MTRTEPIRSVTLTTIGCIEILTNEIVDGEVGIARYIFHHTGYTKVHFIIGEDQFAHWIFITEQF